MTVKLPTKHHLEFLSLKETAQARPSLFMSKYHIVRNCMQRLNYVRKPEHDRPTKLSGLQVIKKKKSCSTQLSIKFQLLMKPKMLKNTDFSCF